MSERESLFDAPCEQEPGIYGHWYCQRRRWHRGPHRFNNYTWRRGATPWAAVRRGARWLRLFLARENRWRRDAKVHAISTKSTYAPLNNDDRFWGERYRRDTDV